MNVQQTSQFRCARLLCVEYPSCLQATRASTLKNPALHTVPHLRFRQTSIRPSFGRVPPTSLMLPSLQAMFNKISTCKQYRAENIKFVTTDASSEHISMQIGTYAWHMPHQHLHHGHLDRNHKFQFLGWLP